MTPAALRPDTATHAWLKGTRSFLIVTLSIFFVLIHIYASVFGSPGSLFFRSLHVNVALLIVLLAKPLGGSTPRWWQRAIDLFCLAGVVWVLGYFVAELETWHLRTIFFRPIDYITAILFIGLILEATRRTIGMILVVICAFFLVHALNADHFGGVFYGPPASLENLLQAVFLDSSGIFGVAVAVMANFVVLFILFGTLLNASGGGEFFTRLAFALFGHRVGGPAKAAVTSSAMMGSLSGSAIGNVLTTGAFTIPLMIRLGYKRAFAGGVEAAASNGGIIMPPVMGAVAFIMAEFLDRPYLEIIMAAIIPALLYFLVIFVTVDTEARKHGLPTMPKERLPRAWALFRRDGYLFLPIVLIVAALIAGYSIVMVAVFVTAGTFLIALIQPRNRLRPTVFADVVEDTARSTVALSVTAAAAGIILGSIYSVGLSFQVAQAATQAAQGYLWLLLVLTAVMALIMGLGMTAPAIYLTLVATVIPILVTAGIPPIAAHFFAFYYGIISNITPPVALTAYAAAPIARCGPLEIGAQASRLGAACFVLPILFIYEPGLLLEDDLFGIIQVTVTSAIGLVAFALAATGYAFGPMTVWQRLGALLVCFLAIVPEWTTHLAAVALAVVVFGANYMSRNAAPKKAVAAVKIDDGANSGQDGGLLARIARSRIRNEVDADPNAIASPETDIETLMEQFSKDPPQQPAPPARELWIGWGVVCLTALAMLALGDAFAHARQPLMWAVAHLAMAIVLGAVVMLARSQPTTLDHHVSEPV